MQNNSQIKNTKICYKCNIEKQTTDFYKRNNALHNKCKSCFNDYQRDFDKLHRLKPEVKKYHKEYNAENYDSNKQKEYDNLRRISKQEYHIIKTYGINFEQYDKMFEKQNGKCAICSTTKLFGKGNSLHIDHYDDENRKPIIRGLLCQNCNQAIGKLKHDPKICVSASEYLKRFH